MSVTEQILSELLCIKGAVAQLPTRGETRQIALETATVTAAAAADAAVKKHVDECNSKRAAVDEDRKREIRISKKSALWWIRITGAVLFVMSAGAGAWAVIKELARAVQ